MKINKAKFICRILDVVVIISSIILTPMAINYAKSMRGYEAVGGEYLIPILGLLIVMITETIYEEIENRRKNKWLNIIKNY